MKLWGMVLTVCGVLLTGSQVYAAPVTDHVVINEIMANPATGEVEWIELYNPTDVAVAMSGWRLVVTSGNFSGVFASDVVIASHGYVVRKASDTASKLNNTSATISLKPSASGAAIDEVAYSGIAQAKTYARTCDASDTWVAQAVPTQGAANCTVTPPPAPDTTPPSIDEIAGGEIRQIVSLAITAYDEASSASVVAIVTQYGTEVARCEGVGGCTLEFDSTTVPNGPAELKITAKDAAGNIATKTVAYTIVNALPTQPPKNEPTSQPVISTPTPATPETAPVVEDTPGRGAALPTLQTIAVTKSIANASIPTSKAQLAIATVAKPAAPRASVAAVPANTTATQNNDTEVSATLPVEAAKELATTTPAALPEVPWQWPAIAAFIGSFAAVTVWRWRRRDKT